MFTANASNLHPAPETETERLAWTHLIMAGVPDGAIRPMTAQKVDPQRLADALEVVVRASLSIRRVEPLLAWLRGFRQHWPKRFEQVFGRRGDEVVERLSNMPVDANRYLKLRRIAIQNLSR